MATDLANQSTTPASNSSIASINTAEGCAPSGINDAIRGLTAQAKGALLAVTSAGTNTVTATYAPVPDAYVSGWLYPFKAGGTNTGATTFNANSLGAKDVKRVDNTGSAVALAGGEIVSGGFYELRYDGTDMILASPAAAHPVGSVTAPGIAFAGDTNSGFYRIGADNIGVAVGGASVANWSSTTYTITSADAGAGEGPVFALDRNSASPEVNDLLGIIRFNGRDAGAAVQTYAQVYSEILDKTAGSEDAALHLSTVVAGSLGSRVQVAQGVQVGSPTGGDKGAGSINVAGDIYKNNSAYANPDYVFELAYTGKVERFAENEGAADYRLRSLEEMEAFTRENLHLPGAHEVRGMFQRGDWTLERLEELYLHVFELSRRLKALGG